jgi:hypothetical protein
MKKIVCSIWNTAVDFLPREHGDIQLHDVDAAFLLNDGRRQDLIDVMAWWDHLADLTEERCEKRDRS